MSDKMRFEGLTLTVDDVRRSIDCYGGKLGLSVEVNAAPAFAIIRAPRGGTIGLLAMADAQGERSMTALDPDGYAVELAPGRRGHNKT